MRSSTSKAKLRTRLLHRLLQVQTSSGFEHLMVDFLVKHCRKHGYRVDVDAHRNVYITKGKAEAYPAVSAHIDTVQPFMHVEISYDRGAFIGHNRTTSRRCGIGGDCKSGVFVCLELLRRLPTLKVVLFSMEEVGCIGARASNATWFKDVGYVIEFDCPSRNLMSYTSSGTRLFDNNGAFIRTAFPTLQKYGVAWQNHPYTDVSVIAPKYRLSCLNLASGYYRWHSDTEFVYVPDVKNAVEMGRELVQALGNVKYALPTDYEASRKTLSPVTYLSVTEPSQFSRPHLPVRLPRVAQPPPTLYDGAEM